MLPAFLKKSAILSSLTAGEILPTAFSKTAPVKHGSTNVFTTFVSPTENTPTRGFRKPTPLAPPKAVISVSNTGNNAADNFSTRPTVFIVRVSIFAASDTMTVRIAEKHAKSTISDVFSFRNPEFNPFSMPDITEITTTVIIDGRKPSAPFNIREKISPMKSLKDTPTLPSISLFRSSLKPPATNALSSSESDE